MEITLPKNPEEMVATQIAVRDITDQKVLEAMASIPRDLFVLQKHLPLAYSDQALPIGFEQTISQPYVVAFMTQALGIQANHKVLEIGTGSGYQTAILASIAKTVYSVEFISNLFERAKTVLTGLGFKNIHLKCSDGRLGWQEFAPYDRIIVTAASEDIPASLVTQLAQSGKMIIPLGRQVWSQELVLITKNGEKIIRKNLLPVRFVPLVKQKFKTPKTKKT